MEQKKEEINIDFANFAVKIFHWIKQNYVIFLVLIPVLISIFIRIQPLYLPIMVESAQNNIHNSIQGSVEQAISAQYPNLPAANRQALVQQQVDEIYAQGFIEASGQQYNIDDLVAQNAEALKKNFRDEYGLTYLGEIDPWFFYRMTKNYLDHGYEGDIEINGQYYNTHQLGGTPRELIGSTSEKLPHFHVAVEAYLYKFISLFLPDVRLMSVIYFLPVLLATLSVIPAFFLVRKVAGDIGALVASILVAVHPAFVGRTIAGFSDTDGYNILFPLFIMWIFIEAVESKKQKIAIFLAGIAGLFVGLFSTAWGGWWYIYDFLIGVCFISLWYVYAKEWTAVENKKTRISRIMLAIIFAPFTIVVGFIQTIKKAVQSKEYAAEQCSEQYLVTVTIFSFMIACAVFVSLFSSPVAYINAIMEPFSFITIKDVGVTKIWPNVLTTVAEFNPASLNDILNTLSFGMPILLFFAFLGIGYVLFERSEFPEDQRYFIALSIVWTVGIIFIKSRMQSDAFYVFILLVPVVVAIYKKVPAIIEYVVGVSAWYAAMLRFIPWFASHLYIFFISITLPVIIAILYVLIDRKKIDLKYGILLCIWFVGTIYASTKGVRFIMILVPAFGVAAGLGVAFTYNIWSEALASFLKLKEMYVRGAIIIVVAILLVVPFFVGYNTGYNQIPLINDQWYDALKKIDNEAAPDAIISSWWDYGHWFKAIGDRAVTFDGSSQDTPQAHWIGRVLLTNDEEEAIAILRMLDCGGNTAYDTIVNSTEDPYTALLLTKKIIMQTSAEARQTLHESGFTDEQTNNILDYTHCNPPEAYFITSQDMVGKAPVWAHFGAWNFDKSYVVNVMNKYPKELAITKIENTLSVSVEEAGQLYTEAVSNDPNNWIAPWPSYVSMPTGCWQEEMFLLCNSGLMVNLTNGEALIQTTSNTYSHPKAMMYVNPDGGYETKYFTDYAEVFVNNGRAYSAAIIPTDGGFSSFFVDDDLLESMFTKLFFYKGHGLACFDLFDYQSTVTQEEIYVWKVDWSCADKNVVFEKTQII